MNSFKIQSFKSRSNLIFLLLSVLTQITLSRKNSNLEKRSNALIQLLSEISLSDSENSSASTSTSNPNTKHSNSKKVDFDSTPELFLPKYYATVCLDQDESYADYQNYKFKYGDASNYEVLGELGHGSFGAAYKALNKKNGKTVVIKVLYEGTKIVEAQREVMIMEMLKDNENINQLVEVIKNQTTNTPAIVMEYVNMHGLKQKKIFLQFNDFDCRYYIYLILRALDYANSKGIFHRDLKPSNIVIDHEQRIVRIIDWGTAIFYIPGEKYSLHISNYHFKAPEAWVGIEQYHYSLDMWNLGCLFGAMIFRINGHIFKGEDHEHQLEKIASFRGTDKLFEYVDKFQTTIEPEYEKHLNEHETIPWSDFIDSENEDLANEEALELLEAMLTYDHSLRPMARDLLAFKYFDPVRSFFPDDNYDEQ